MEVQLSQNHQYEDSSKFGQQSRAQQQLKKLQFILKEQNIIKENNHPSVQNIEHINKRKLSLPTVQNSNFMSKWNQFSKFNEENQKIINRSMQSRKVNETFHNESNSSMVLDQIMNLNLDLFGQKMNQTQIKLLHRNDEKVIAKEKIFDKKSKLNDSTIKSNIQNNDNQNIITNSTSNSHMQQIQERFNRDGIGTKKDIKSVKDQKILEFIQNNFNNSIEVNKNVLSKSSCDQAKKLKQITKPIQYIYQDQQIEDSLHSKQTKYIFRNLNTSIQDNAIIKDQFIKKFKKDTQQKRYISPVKDDSLDLSQNQKTKKIIFKKGKIQETQDDDSQSNSFIKTKQNKTNINSVEEQKNILPNESFEKKNETKDRYEMYKKQKRPISLSPIQNEKNHLNKNSSFIAMINDIKNKNNLKKRISNDQNASDCSSINQQIKNNSVIKINIINKIKDIEQQKNPINNQKNVKNIYQLIRQQKLSENQDQFNQEKIQEKHLEQSKYSQITFQEQFKQQIELQDSFREQIEKQEQAKIVHQEKFKQQINFKEQFSQIEIDQVKPLTFEDQSLKFQEQTQTLKQSKLLQIDQPNLFLQDQSKFSIDQPQIQQIKPQFQDFDIRNQFDCKHIIGKGGFGKVYKVYHKDSDKIYAMKEMSKSRIITKRSINSVLNERKLLSSLKHPFIVNMIFAFQDRQNLYLVMDIMQGGDLRYHLGKKKKFNEEQSKFFIASIIVGLDYLHSKRIIHRDIKPENLVLENTGYVRITDLGIARELRPDNSSDTSGTPGYMGKNIK